MNEQRLFADFMCAWDDSDVPERATTRELIEAGETGETEIKNALLELFPEGPTSQKLTGCFRRFEGHSFNKRSVSRYGRLRGVVKWMLNNYNTKHGKQA